MRKRLLQVVRDGFEDARVAHLQGAGQKVPVRMRRFHLAWFRKMQGNCLRKKLGERIDLEQVDME